MADEVPMLTPRRMPGRAAPVVPAAEADAAVPASASWWHVLSAPGEVSLGVRRQRVGLAVAWGVAAWLSAMLAVGVAVWPSPEPTDATLAPAVVADAAGADAGPSRGVRYRVRPRAAAASVAAVRPAGGGVARRGPADVLLALPTDRKLQLFSWTLSCEGGEVPPVASGRIEDGTPALRIPMVPPVPCDLTFTGGAVQVRVTAGARLECLWQGQLVCR
ncbi:MAG: hypothetical protein RLZZ383_1617 [Pseudomonadota bacterium]|jgi:hypothetical protein